MGRAWGFVRFWRWLVVSCSKITAVVGCYSSFLLIWHGFPFTTIPDADGLFQPDNEPWHMVELFRDGLRRVKITLRCWLYIFPTSFQASLGCFGQPRQESCAANTLPVSDWTPSGLRYRSRLQQSKLDSTIKLITQIPGQVMGLCSLQPCIRCVKCRGNFWGCCWFKI